MGIETDTLDDYLSHPALCRGDYACLHGREKDHLYELPVLLDMKAQYHQPLWERRTFGVPVSDRQIDQSTCRRCSGLATIRFLWNRTIYENLTAFGTFCFLEPWQ